MHPLMLKLSEPHTELADGYMGLVYKWRLSNGITFVVIDLFTHFQRIFGEKYEVKAFCKGEEIDIIGLENYTSSTQKLNEYLKISKEHKF